MKFREFLDVLQYLAVGGNFTIQTDDGVKIKKAGEGTSDYTL